MPPPPNATSTGLAFSSYPSRPTNNFKILSTMYFISELSWHDWIVEKCKWTKTVIRFFVRLKYTTLISNGIKKLHSSQTSFNLQWNYKIQLKILQKCKKEVRGSIKLHKRWRDGRKARDRERRQRHYINRYITFFLNNNSFALICMQNCSNLILL